VYEYRVNEFEIKIPFPPLGKGGGVKKRVRKERLLLQFSTVLLRQKNSHVNSERGQLVDPQVNV
jgi:hypothetical protein